MYKTMTKVLNRQLGYCYLQLNNGRILILGVHMSYEKHIYFIFVITLTANLSTAYPSLVEHHAERPFFYDVSSNYFKEHIFTGGNQ